MYYKEIFTLTQESLNEIKVNGFKKIVRVCDTDEYYAISEETTECLKAIAKETRFEYNEYDETKNEWFEVYELCSPELTELIKD